MSDALEWLRQLPFGQSCTSPWLPGIGCFRIYNLIEARIGSSAALIGSGEAADLGCRKPDRTQVVKSESAAVR